LPTTIPAKDEGLDFDEFLKFYADVKKNVGAGEDEEAGEEEDEDEE
jgi:hypothetical protein